jgi:hypothetical protein
MSLRPAWRARWCRRLGPTLFGALAAARPRRATDPPRPPVGQVSAGSGRAPGVFVRRGFGLRAAGRDRHSSSPRGDSPGGGRSPGAGAPTGAPRLSPRDCDRRCRACPGGGGRFRSPPSPRPRDPSCSRPLAGRPRRRGLARHGAGWPCCASSRRPPRGRRPGARGGERGTRRLRGRRRISRPRDDHRRQKSKPLAARRPNHRRVVDSTRPRPTLALAALAIGPQHRALSDRRGRGALLVRRAARGREAVDRTAAPQRARVAMPPGPPPGAVHLDPQPPPRFVRRPHCGAVLRWCPRSRAGTPGVLVARRRPGAFGVSRSGCSPAFGRVDLLENRARMPGKAQPPPRITALLQPGALVDDPRSTRCSRMVELARDRPLTAARCSSPTPRTPRLQDSAAFFPPAPRCTPRPGWPATSPPTPAALLGSQGAQRRGDLPGTQGQEFIRSFLGLPIAPPGGARQGSGCWSPRPGRVAATSTSSRSAARPRPDLPCAPDRGRAWR